jgi:phosphate uptake regulator
LPKDRSEAVIRKTVSTYLAGYNKIHVKAGKQQTLSAEQRHSIRDFVHEMFVGTEIVTNTPSELTLQVLLSYPELSIQSALGRMGVMASSMHKDAIAALKQHDNVLAKSVTSADNEVDRFNLYLVRQLKTAIQNPRIIKEIGLTDARDCLGYRLIAKAVERTADHAVKIAENTMAMKHKLDSEITKKIDEMSSIAISMFEVALESLSRKDYALAETMIERVNEIIALEKKVVMSCKIDPEDEGNLRLIIESVRRTAEYSSDIAEVVLNLTVETIIE